jgi:hypothetical protein
VKCTIFFWSSTFQFWNLVFFFKFVGIFENVSFSCLGISCLIMFEWMRYALFFGGPTFFILGLNTKMYFFQIFVDILSAAWSFRVDGRLPRLYLPGFLLRMLLFFCYFGGHQVGIKGMCFSWYGVYCVLCII